ncbi:hypothetical protein WJX73_002063 [Symbiochloris irregularis]|uniref:JmjC domain-containing protein n=1 Tax=Symbiochloris irregularis TaxID=706552 RepID=A0AAW1NZ90_9CHLO
MLRKVIPRQQLATWLENSCRQQSTAVPFAAAASTVAHREVPKIAWTQDKAHEIQEQLLEAEEPAVLTGALTRWPLLKWTWKDLRKLGDVVVPMEISWHGSDYRDLFRTHTSMTDPEPPQLKKYETDVELPLFYLLDHITQKEEGKNSASPAAGRGKAVKMYLAQKDIKDVLPQLQQELAPLPLQEAQTRLYRQSVWLGPQGTVTPLHRDPYSNLFAQILGAKRIQLVHPSQTGMVQPFASPLVLRNTSEIDMEEVDARCAEDGGGGDVRPWEVTLRPGEMLYIPKSWWHHIHAVEPSFSVSCWWP